MSDEQILLTRGATSLTLMLKGFDEQLDLRLEGLRDVLRQKEFQGDEFQQHLAAVENVYDQLEQSSDKNVELYIKTFNTLLAGSAPDVLEPLNRAQPLLSDLLNFAEPLASFVRSQSIRSDTTDSTSLDDLRLRLGNRFKSLLQTLMLMGDDRGLLTALIDKLDNNPSWQSLDSLASTTIDLLQFRLSEEKKEFEGYLAELNAKLARINDIVAADSVILSEIKELNIEFNSSINMQMISARAKIDEQHKVDALKSELLQSLDQITTRLVEYQVNYANRLENLQTSKVEMNKQIRSLEQDNIDLLTELNKERKLGMLDTLTQLPNRLGFNNRLEAELSRAKRYDHPISVGIIDIDFFKRINDEFGHLVGDKVLRMIAGEMKRVCRDHDYIARYGGEEFILLLPQTELADAYVALEKIRTHVANCPFHFQNKPVPLNISAGVAQRRLDESTEAWINRADVALYHSKHNGRNRVTVEDD
ncbi:diguanylate cyclase [Reinekea sp.]|jgi:diguanylate cyclase|uniref:sensor domain-containing diguanylate cyclase n=1 Tax=Reinekea sp. TaxID=1970455 RepID=UPI002A7F7285|nr:diguanylate cyclase [Reinekea sp.]